MEWISVKDRLPESGSCVMAYTGDIEKAIYCDNRFTAFDEYGYQYEIRDVTHWIPFRKPPNSDREEI